MLQLSSEEKQKLKKMLKAQSAYTQYVRKEKDSSSLKAKKLADKGFKYESLAFKSHAKLVKYKELLKKKYSKK
jgi:hypothetical protein